MQTSKTPLEFRFGWLDYPSIISNHDVSSRETGFLYQGYARAEIKISVDDIKANSHLGTCYAGASPLTQELHSWCLDSFGPEWKRWHLKLIVYENPFWSRSYRTDHTVLVEVTIAEKSDFALFKLAWG